MGKRGPQSGHGIYNVSVNVHASKDALAPGDWPAVIGLSVGSCTTVFDEEQLTPYPAPSVPVNRRNFRFSSRCLAAAGLKVVPPHGGRCFFLVVHSNRLANSLPASAMSPGGVIALPWPAVVQV